ncbi:Protein of unknown function [Bacillus sp. OV194]|nr:Protein of unknown function [Bacillus sp. OV194]
MNTVILNDKKFDVTDLHLTTTASQLKKIRFKFKVEHSEYHDITTLLYKNDFEVKVPEKDLRFRAEISQYSTSITDLYKENAVGDFALELTEKE